MSAEMTRRAYLKAIRTRAPFCFYAALFCAGALIGDVVSLIHW